ncbi:MAG: beta-hydroxyacyl-ACP dehydratase [Planctomycetes bacterium]|jgi:3-hydroxyacyl-[acyl-carrier-protein] dehydratase|nr:beta-hydroxyacyl-ACP dehydratase [Planctomycetota bacterium]
MPPALLFDLAPIDLNREPLFDKDAICTVNPQRFEMQQLDGILWCDREHACILGYKDVTSQEFWVRGHIPGRPLMPGVLQIEAAAQLLSFFVTRIFEESGFIGFGGIEHAKFRAPIEPDCRLYLLGHVTEARRGRRYVCDVQGVVSGTLAFEATISGMKL